MRLCNIHYKLSETTDKTHQGHAEESAAQKENALLKGQYWSESESSHSDNAHHLRCRDAAARA